MLEQGLKLRYQNWAERWSLILGNEAEVQLSPRQRNMWKENRLASLISLTLRSCLGHSNPPDLHLSRMMIVRFTSKL